MVYEVFFFADVAYMTFPLSYMWPPPIITNLNTYYLLSSSPSSIAVSSALFPCVLVPSISLPLSGWHHGLDRVCAGLTPLCFPSIPLLPFVSICSYSFEAKPSPVGSNPTAPHCLHLIPLTTATPSHSPCPSVVSGPFSAVPGPFIAAPQLESFELDFLISERLSTAGF